MSRSVGQISERIAANFLVKKGFSILGQNVTYRFGELDLVAMKKGVLVFVEVKMRKNLAYGLPYEAITTSKQRKIILAARAYLARFRGAYDSCRFDVVSLLGIPPDVEIDHIEGAFTLEDCAWPAY